MMNRSLLPLALLATTCLPDTGTARDAVTELSQSAPLEVAARSFKSYVLQKVAESLAAVQTLRDRVAEADLQGAQQAWLAARNGWESSEVVTAEYFPDLDRAIDGWPDAEKGFHAIEARLFGAHATDAQASADQLVRDLTEFQHQLQGTTLTAQRLLSGVSRLTYEIGEDKAGGGESPFSGNSLAEIGSNVNAIAAVYRQVFAPSAKGTGAAARMTADLQGLKSLTAVASLRELDQTALREQSEILTEDLGGLSEQLGLRRPSLGN